MKYATLVVSVLIIIAVTIPGKDLPDVDIGAYDKLIHMSMFAVWAVAARYDFSKSKSDPAYVIIFACGLFFSLLTELLQLPIEGRNFDPYDMAADAFGLIAGLLISGRILRWINRWK